MQKTKFTPTDDMVSAANTVFLAMAWVETIRPVVEGYQQEILDYEKYDYAEKHRKRRGKTQKEWITRPFDDYLMSKKDFNHYMGRCREEQEKAKLKTTDPDHCPLLEAETLLTQAEWVLIESMQSITGIEPSTLYLDNRKKFLDLALKLLAPFAKNVTEDWR